MTRKQVIHAYLIAAISLVVVGIALWLPGKVLRSRWYYLNFRGADLYVASIERSRRFASIWDAIEQYKESEGIYPTTRQDLLDEFPSQRFLFDDLKWSIDPISVNFSSLGFDELEILIEDPGYNWPGSPAKEKITNLSHEIYRVYLLNDGTVITGGEEVLRDLGIK